MENIVNIEIEKIQSHPEQDKVYSTELDYQFIESVKAVGILQAVLLAKGEIVDGKIILKDDCDSYIAVSGHRRIKASKEVGNLTIPAIIKDYKHPILIDLDFIESNRNREKNETEKKHEFGMSYQILSQIAKYKLNKGDKFSLNNNLEEDKGGLRTMSEGSEFFQNIEEFLTKIGVDISKPLDLRTSISLATGLSEREVRRKMKLEEGYFGNRQVKWEKLLTNDKLKKHYEEYYRIKGMYRNEEISEDEAIDKLEVFFKKVDAIYDKALGEVEKPKKEKKEKVYLSIPITKNPNHELESKVYEDELKLSYHVVNPVKVGKTLREEFGRELEWVEYMEKIIPKMKDCKFYAPRGDVFQRGQSIGCRITDVVSIVLGMKWI